MADKPKKKKKAEMETDLPLFSIEQQQLRSLFFISNTEIVLAVQSVRTERFDSQAVLLDQLVMCIEGEVVQRPTHVCKVCGASRNEFALNESWRTVVPA